jgi:hypothetical protein
MLEYTSEVGVSPYPAIKSVTASRCGMSRASPVSR